MATDLATLSVRVQANFDRYNRAFKKAVADTNRHMSKIESRVSRGRKRVQASFAAIGKVGALIGVGVATAFASGVKGALEYADSIDKMSASAGIGAEKLQALRFAAEQTGTGAEFLTKGIERFNRRIGEFANTGKGPAGSGFKMLEIEILDANGALRPTESLLDEVFEKLGNVQDGARRAAIAAKFFGERAGPQMSRMLAIGADGIKDFEKQAHDTGKVLSAEMIREADAIGDEWESLMVSMDRIFKKFVLTTLVGFSQIRKSIPFVGESTGLDRLDELRQEQDEIQRKAAGLGDTIEKLSAQAVGQTGTALTRRIEVMTSQLEGGLARLNEINSEMLSIQNQIDPDVQPPPVFTELDFGEDDGKKKRRGGRAKTEQDVFGDIIKGIHERTRALESEQAILSQTSDERLKIANLEAEISAREKAGLEVSLGLRMELADARATEVGELERLGILHDALNEMAKEGKNLTAKQRAEIEKLAKAMGTLAAETEKVAEAEEARADASEEAARKAEEAADKQKEVQDAMKDSARDAIGVLAELSKGTLEWEDALLAVLDILIRMQEAGALEDILGGGKSGKGGFDLFGSLLGGIGGLFGGGGSSSGAFMGVGNPNGLPPGFAAGGRPPVGKVAMVGERGPELFMPDRAGSIINARDTAAMLKPANSNRSQAGVTINAPININAPMTQEQTMFTANQIEKSLGRVARRGVGRL